MPVHRSGPGLFRVERDRVSGSGVAGRESPRSLAWPDWPADDSRKAGPVLRGHDLVLNEANSVVIPKRAFITEEPDLEALFNAAVDEISEQLDDDDFDADYGFQSEWEDEELDEEDLE